MHLNGCRGWIRTTIIAFKGRCPTVRRPGDELVEPEVVATSPYRIKSPVPVCCGFDSVKGWAREDLHLQGSQPLDLRGLLFPLMHEPAMRLIAIEPLTSSASSTG